MAVGGRVAVFDLPLLVRLRLGGALRPLEPPALPDSFIFRDSERAAFRDEREDPPLDDEEVLRCAHRQALLRELWKRDDERHLHMADQMQEVGMQMQGAPHMLDLSHATTGAIAVATSATAQADGIEKDGECSVTNLPSDDDE